MAQKPLGLDSNGNVTEMNPISVSSGAADAGKLVQTNAAGLLDTTFSATNTTVTALATEAIAAGNFFNVWSNAGVASIRKADAATGRVAHGFVNASVALGASVAVTYGAGMNSNLSGMTPGMPQFLGASGARTETPPTTAGYYLQELGVAKSATELSFVYNRPIIRA